MQYKQAEKARKTIKLNIKYLKRWPRFTDVHSKKKRAGIGDRTLKWCLLTCIYDSCSALSKDLITDPCHLFINLLM